MLLDYGDRGSKKDFLHDVHLDTITPESELHRSEVLPIRPFCHYRTPPVGVVISFINSLLYYRNFSYLDKEALILAS